MLLIYHNFRCGMGCSYKACKVVYICIKVCNIFYTWFFGPSHLKPLSHFQTLNWRCFALNHFHQFFPSTPFVNHVAFSCVICCTLKTSLVEATWIDQCIASLTPNGQLVLLLLQIMSHVFKIWLSHWGGPSKKMHKCQNDKLPHKF